MNMLVRSVDHHLLVLVPLGWSAPGLFLAQLIIVHLLALQPDCDHLSPWYGLAQPALQDLIAQPVAAASLSQPVSLAPQPDCLTWPMTPTCSTLLS